ncbi:MAG: hypothetical protein LIP28_08820, partial [Deltaproteobacteria bacterium]|nr:hypothetical protein [Deltaproteobacteria bacterium]
MDAHKGQITYNLLSRELPFIRPIYRTLLSRRRTYAAFEAEQIVTILDKIKPTGTVLDPMSGYGVLAEICRERNIPTCCMEINPPSYLWQVLLEPNNKLELLFACEVLEQACKNIRAAKDFEASDTWFPSESVNILKQLWHRASSIMLNKLKSDKGETYLAAVLLPFLGRLSSHSEGTINIQVKKSGVVFYKDWKRDFKNYLSLIANSIIEKYEDKSIQSEILFINSLDHYEIETKYSYIITSPPYPN